MNYGALRDKIEKAEREATYGSGPGQPDPQVTATLVLAQVQLELALMVDRLTVELRRATHLR
jgi:hypothetical protein